MLKATAKIEKTVEGINVDVVWTGTSLDRPSTDRYSLRANHMGLALRLKNAVEAQAVYFDPKIATDVDGKTYVEATSRVLGRTLNADLRRLGF